MSPRPKSKRAVSKAPPPASPSRRCARSSAKQARRGNVAAKTKAKATPPKPATKTPPLPRRRRRKRARLSEAMRKAGIDEHKLAETYVGVFDKLTGNRPKESVEKLLVDVLKECTRILESPRSGDREPSTDAPAVVQLVHNVPRPERATPDAAK